MYKAEGKTKPSKIDDTSSKNYVYIRENIKTEKRKDENGKNETFYVWDEKKIRKDVYEVVTEQENLKNRVLDLEKSLKGVKGD
ncbi:MAG: hypothetical protein II722_02405 [Ruminococcus sp.]|jgi:hypothetical protein|nr:hypothetical protein [Ruminococcus sp.]MBQ3935885.1 hypothetical protein [Ruminococcus sp.]